MKCPYCGNEMELGYIQCRDGIAWGKKKKPIAALSALGAELVFNNDTGIFSGSSVETYNCPDCQKLIIDYKKQ